MNYRVVAERTAYGSVQIRVGDRLIPPAELQAALATVDATVTDADVARLGAQLFCHPDNKVSHIYEFNSGVYAVVPGLPESIDLLGREAFARVLAGGRLQCPYGTVNRGAISEAEITAWSKMEPKLLVGLDALGHVNYVEESNRALANRRLTARLPTPDEMKAMGKELRRRKVRVHPNIYAWTFTLDNKGEPVAVLESIRRSGQLTNRLGYFPIVSGRWCEDDRPQDRFDSGVPVLVVSKAT